jgi:glutamine synthetase
LEKAKILPDYLGAEYMKIYAQVKQAEFGAFMDETFSREFEWYL